MTVSNVDNQSAVAQRALFCLVDMRKTVSLLSASYNIARMARSPLTLGAEGLWRAKRPSQDRANVTPFDSYRTLRGIRTPAGLRRVWPLLT